jgi:hypothetical protein
MADLRDAPINKLIQVALDEPIERVSELCSTSNRLFRVCDSEMFWEERIKKDFPKYTPTRSLPTSLTYKRYYQMLWKIWNLKDGNYHIFQEITQSKGSRRNNIVSANGITNLIYPVPYFNDEEGHLKPDVVILDQSFAGKKYLFLGFFNRRTVTGDNVPTIGQDLDQWPLAEIARVNKEAGEQATEFIANNGSFYDRYFFVENNKENIKKLEAELSEIGYLKFPVERIFERDTDLFLQRMFVKVPKPTLAQPKAASPKVASPPVTRNKLKNIFSFLNPSSGN